jgi:hypothetical protein
MHRFFQLGYRFMSRAAFDERFRRTAPDHHQTIGSALPFKVADVLAKLFRQFHLVLARLYVRTIEALHVVLIEDCFARLDGREQRLYLFE